jgi:hypothetical protein
VASNWKHKNGWKNIFISKQYKKYYGNFFIVSGRILEQVDFQGKIFMNISLKASHLKFFRSPKSQSSSQKRKEKHSPFSFYENFPLFQTNKVESMKNNTIKVL